MNGTKICDFPMVDDSYVIVERVTTRSGTPGDLGSGVSLRRAYEEAKLLRLRVKLLRHESVGFKQMLKQIGRTRQAGLSLAVTYLNSGNPQQCVNVCVEALKKTGGNKTEAARLLGLKFRSFRHKLSKYGIKGIEDA